MPDREWSHGLHVLQDHTRLARFTWRASSSPALLALLPLQNDVLRERPAPLRPDAQSARLIMSVTQEQTHCPSHYHGYSRRLPAVALNHLNI